MENRPLGHEETDDSTSESTSKKKRGVSRLTQLLSGIRNKEKEENSEKHPDDEKPKRFRSLFSKLFPKVVENPNQEDIERQHQFDPESWFSWMRPTEVDATTTPPEDEPEPQPRQEVLPAEQTSREEVEDVSPELPEELPEILPETNAERVVPVELPLDAEEPVELTPQVIEQELYTRDQPQAETTPATNEPLEKETVIERGPGMVLPVALVGLEHLGRKKADKKLEKRVNDKITATNHEVTRNAALQQELETLTRQNQEQLEALKRARANEAADINRAIELAKEPNPEHKGLASELKKPSPEVTRITTAEKVTIPEPLVEREKPQEEIQPERILEQVADAAEQNIAVERVFERSHEVKDEQNAPGVAASIGSVMASRTNNITLPVASPIQTDSKQPSSLPFLSDKVATEAYRQAMKAGFWSAIVIIILGSIAYLVIQ